MRRWVGVCTGTMKPLPYQRHIPLQLILWEYPRALKCFALASLDQQGLFNFPSNALFCILEVWQDCILTVVLRLLSRGTNFHSNKNIRNYQHKTDSSVSDFILMIVLVGGGGLRG